MSRLLGGFFSGFKMDFYTRLYHQNERAMKFGLDAIRKAMAYDVELVAYPHWLVGGTNGKGQVSALLANAANLLGYRTGLFTSPHLVEFRERIRIDGHLIDENELISIGEGVLSQFGGEDEPEFTGTALTYFECCFMMALRAFKQNKVQFGVFEVGLGGRLDATNSLSPQLSIITSIGRDHEEYLGHETAQIAREKAGIMREGCPVVAGRGEYEVLKEEARGHGCVSFDALGHEFGWYREKDKIFLKSRFGVIPMPGAEKLANYQIDNASVAFFALLRASELGLLQGDLNPVLSQLIERTIWVGRLWHCSSKTAQNLGVADVVLDGAHNPDGVRAFIEAIQSNAGPKALIVNSCSDKDLESMFPMYGHVFDSDCIFVVPMTSTKRACTPHEYCERLGLPVLQACDSLSGGLSRAAQIVGCQGTIYISGSLYLIGEAISLLGEQKALESILR